MIRMTVAPENATAGGERQKEAEKKQVEFHKRMRRFYFMQTGRNQ
jgi:hypothetical protein